MLKKLTSELEEELFIECNESLKRGISVRRRNVLYSTFVLSLLLVILASIDGVSGSFVIAITVAASSLCMIWAVMSMSASMNAQFDILTKLFVHYLLSDLAQPK